MPELKSLEFEALGRYALLILTVVTQSVQELPLKRVYLRMLGLSPKPNLWGKAWKSKS